ncbi:MAG: sulfurtransferase TusA family protein, partial [Thermoplasmata archaeon]
RSPFEGAVVEQNPELLTRPRWINDDPYGKGWVARIRASGAVPAQLADAAAVRGRLASWMQEHHVRCWPVPPDYQMFEIGLECSAILAQLNDELARRPAGTAVMIVTDDPTSPIEMERWSDQTGHALLAKRREEGLFEFLVRKEEHPVPRVPRRG